MKTLPKDVSPCDGAYCKIKELCLRYTVLPAAGNTDTVTSPHTAQAQVECGLFMLNLKKGSRARFFHPYTFGTMLLGTVLEVMENNEGVKVRFDSAYNKRAIYVVPPIHIKD